jgi:hypothetical protein
VHADGNITAVATIYDPSGATKISGSIVFVQQNNESFTTFEVRQKRCCRCCSHFFSLPPGSIPG